MKRWKWVLRKEREREEGGWVGDKEWERGVRECQSHMLPKEEGFGVRLKSNIKRGREIGVSEEVLQWVGEGVRTKKLRKARSREPKNKITEEQEPFVWREVERFRRMGVLERVEGRPMLVHPLVVAEKGGKCMCKRWRLCVNGRELNDISEKRSVRMEGMRMVKHVVAVGWWMISIDISDFYLHFGLAKGEEQYWGIWFKGSYWVFKSAVFGFSVSGFVASRVSQELVRVLRRTFAVRGMVWVDDFLFAFRTEEEAKLGAKLVQRFLAGLGFAISIEKSILEPTQSLTYLGLEIHAKEGRLRVGEEKRAGIVEAITKIQEKGVWGKSTAREVAGLVGKLKSVSRAVEAVRGTWELGRPIRVRRPKRFWDMPVFVSPLSLQILKAMKEELIRNKGRFYQVPPDLGVDVIFTDASGTEGWGVVAEVGGAKRVWSVGWGKEEKGWSINKKELWAVRMVFSEEGRRRLGWGRRPIRLFMDSMTALSYVKRGGGRVEELDKLGMEVALEMWRGGVELVESRYIDTEFNPADEPSRRIDSGAWMVTNWVREIAIAVCGPFSMDPFACKESTMAATYYTRWEGPYGAGAGGMNRPWAENSWIVPPLRLLDMAMEEVTSRGTHVTLMIPNWRRAWRDSILDGASWVLYLGGSGREVVEAVGGRKGETEICKSRVVGGWMLVRFCPILQQTRLSHGLDAPLSLKMSGFKNGAAKEGIVHILRSQVCCRSMPCTW